MNLAVYYIVSLKLAHKLTNFQPDLKLTKTLFKARSGGDSKKKVTVRFTVNKWKSLQLQTDVIRRAIDYYREQLCVFGHIGLPRFHMPKSFNDRMDPFLLTLCQVCPKLHTLVSYRSYSITNSFVQ